MLRISAAAIAAVAILTLTAPAVAATPAECNVPMIDDERVSIAIEGNGPDVVLIPGLSTPRDVWHATATRLKSKYRLHLVQIHGFGDDAGANAEGPVLEPMMKVVADYIDDCITDQGRPAPAIIGHSMGGLTGLMIAARAPQEIGKLMIIDALPFIGTLFSPNATAARMSQQAEGMAAMIRAQYGQPWPDASTPDPGAASLSNTDAGRASITAWKRNSDARVTAQVFYDVMTTDMRSELAAVRAPVTLLYAQDDSAMSPEAAKATFEPQYDAVANFTAKMVRGSRHFIMLDQPEAFAAAVDAFLND